LRQRFESLRRRFDIEAVADNWPFAVRRQTTQAAEKLPGRPVLGKGLRRQMGDAREAGIGNDAG
jgi:hypothetical protein